MKRGTGLGRDITVAVIGGLLVLVISAVAVWIWKGPLAHAAKVTGRWFGGDVGVPRWSLALAIAVLAAVAFGLAISSIRRRAHQREMQRAKPAPPIAEAEHFRDTYAAFLRKFVPWNAAARAAGGYDETWHDEYVDLRRDALDALQPIRAPLHEWLRRVDELYTQPGRGEPVWVDADSGPDESLVGLIDKWLRPGDIGRAIGFWNDVEQGDLQRLATDRLELVDSFVRALHRRPDIDDSDRATVVDRLRAWLWRRRRKRMRGRRALSIRSFPRRR